MTNWPPLRAGAPKLSAAGPDRNVTMPSLKVSCADAGAASASAVAADNAATMRLIREKWSMFSSPALPAVSLKRFVRAGCPGVGAMGASLGGLSRRVYDIETGCRPRRPPFIDGGATERPPAANFRRCGKRPVYAAPAH